MPARSRGIILVREKCALLPVASAASTTTSASEFVHTETDHTFDVRSNAAWDPSSLSFSSFTWQLTVFGHGAASLTYKYRNLLHGICLKCSDDQEVDSYRESVVGWTSDQGTEYKISDIAFAQPPNRELLLKASRDIGCREAFLQTDACAQKHFLFPWCLAMTGHLHLISNALESAVTKCRIWTQVKHGIQGLLGFLNSRALRQRLQATCLPKHLWSAFNSFGKQLLDWRWESLGQLLDQVLPLIPILQQHFDLEKMSVGHHSTLSVIDASVLKVTNTFLSLVWIEAFLEMIRCLAITCNYFLSWMEGCQCHSHIWLAPNKNWSQKQKLFFDETGQTTCLNKGCRGCCMAAYGADMWTEKVCQGGSSHLTGLLAKCSEEKRTAILAVQQDLQESVREEFQAKLQHWKHLPYSILGLLDDDVRRAKATARSCRQEWRISDKAKIHRVAHRFFLGQGHSQAI